MTTRDDVIDAINRIERAGHAGEATRAAQVAMLLPLPPGEYDRILARLRAAFPRLVRPDLPEPVPQLRRPSPADEPAGQQGDAARAMKKAEAALSQQRSATAEFDRQVIEALLRAHTTTIEGRRQLDDLDAQIAAAARTWDLGTAAGAREFQRFLLAKIAQIVTVVEETNDDDTAKRALAAAWAALYAAQAGPDGPPPAGAAPDAGAAQHPAPAAAPTDPAPDAWPADELGPGEASAPWGDTPATAPMPTAPGFGAESPGAGSMPAAGLPGGFPLGGALPGPQYQPAANQLGDGLLAHDEPQTADGWLPADSGADEGDDAATDATEAAPDAGSTTVRLPDGETITAATPELAAVIQAAAGGTPVADAFRQQGVTIPAPGTAVTAPVEVSRVGPGDIGMFTDRHALAVGNTKALLDGQIQQIANVRGPSFLGWLHPPALGETTTSTSTPAPTRPSAIVRT